MKQHPHDLRVAYGLPSVELREREATLLARFRSAVTEIEEVGDGYAFRLAGDGETVALVADVIAAEREWCPFLAFELEVHPNTGPVFVRMTGPAGTKEVLKTLLVQACAIRLPF
jgi:hypothetical protein